MTFGDIGRGTGIHRQPRPNPLPIAIDGEPFLWEKVAEGGETLKPVSTPIGTTAQGRRDVEL